MLRCLHAVDARRLQERRSWVVLFSILRPFGPAQASHLSQVRQNLQKAGFLGSWWRRGVVDIPEPISDMCTKEVLVMRFLEGENLVDGIQKLGERAARRQGLTLDDLKRDMLNKFEREGADSASVSEFFRAFRASTASSRCRTASTPSTWPHESLRAL